MPCEPASFLSKMFRHVWAAQSQLSDSGFLRFWDHRRFVDSNTGSCGFPMRSHTGHRPTRHVRALKGPVWVLTAPFGSAFKTTVRGSFVDHVQVLRKKNTGPARAVTTDYGRIPYGCSRASKASTSARTVPRVHRTEPVG